MPYLEKVISMVHSKPHKVQEIQSVLHIMFLKSGACLSATDCLPFFHYLTRVVQLRLKISFSHKKWQHAHQEMYESL